MNFQNILKLAAQGLSDNATSKKLGVSRQLFSHWRNGHRTPNNDMLLKIAELSGVPVACVFVAAFAARLDNQELASDIERLIEAQNTLDNIDVLNHSTC